MEEEEEVMAELPAPVSLVVEWSSSSSDESPPVYATSPVFRRFTDGSARGRGDDKTYRQTDRQRERGRGTNKDKTTQHQNKQASSYKINNLPVGR